MQTYDWEDDSTISAHDWIVERALKRHQSAIFEFWHFLHDFPMMGMAHRIGKKLIRELVGAPKILVGESNWFRAKPEKEFLSLALPPEFVADQRYNNAGQVYRYFADNAKCAVAESTYQKEKTTAWVQEYRTEGLKDILDLRSWTEEDERSDRNDENYNSFLVALIYCELLTQNPEHYFDQEDKARIKWKRAYLMPRFIADSARYCGFTGIMYQSIRYRGDNLVLFNSDANFFPSGVAHEISLTERDLILHRHPVS